MWCSQVLRNPSSVIRDTARRTARPTMSFRDVSTRRIIVALFSIAIVVSWVVFARISIRLDFSPQYSESDIQAPRLPRIVKSPVAVAVAQLDSNLTLIHSIRPYEPTPRPPLEQIVVDWNITGDPQWLLNFAIVGFPKCGTSTMMHYFNQNTEVQIFPNERCDLGGNQQATLIKSLYNDFPPGDYVRGIKCPSDLESQILALPAYGKYFPKTDFIVGIRHPVKWLESFYNHRIHNQFEMPPLREVLNGCRKGIFNVCVQRAAFHWFLSFLRKTDLTDEERLLFGQENARIIRTKKNHGWNGRVFLYDVDQLNDKDQGRSDQFRKDLQNFLHLRKELPPMVWFKPGRKTHSDKVLEKVNQKKIDICDDQHKPVRDRLLEISVNVSTWILDYFLKSPDVVVSNPNLFETLLRQWHIDPCADGGSYKGKTEHLNCTKFGCFLA